MASSAKRTWGCRSASLDSVSSQPQLIQYRDIGVGPFRPQDFVLTKIGNRAEETANMIRYPGHDAGLRIRSDGATIRPLNQGTGREQTGYRWWDKLTWICCGIDRDEDGEMRMQTVRPATAPLFVGATNTSVPNVDVGA